MIMSFNDLNFSSHKLLKNIYVWFYIKTSNYPTQNGLFNSLLMVLIFIVIIIFKKLNILLLSMGISKFNIVNNSELIF